MGLFKEAAVLVGDIRHGVKAGLATVMTGVPHTVLREDKVVGFYSNHGVMPADSMLENAMGMTFNGYPTIVYGPKTKVTWKVVPASEQ